MRPRISYLGLSLGLAFGGNVDLINNGVIDMFISAAMPNGLVSWGLFRLTGATNITLPGE